MTIKEARVRLKRREISPLELVNICKTQFEENQDINAFITPMYDEALKDAEKLINFDDYKPLWGIPIAIKDNIAIKGVRLTCGSKILASYKSLFDATVIENLKKAGAIVVGKTNMDEFAMGSSGEYSAFGSTKNPLDRSLVPGGSSSGSAASVAAGMALGSLGSDTGGSVRQPAAFCGLVGIRPTYGTISRYGLVAFASSVDQIGPIGTSVEDTALLLNVIRSYDKNDSTSVEFLDSNVPKMNEIRIGIPVELEELPIQNEIKTKLEEAKKILEQAGAKFVKISLPSLKYSISTYQLITPSECSANLARFDGVRYGLQVSSDNLSTQYKKTRSEGFGSEVTRRILVGTYALSEGFFDAFYLQACRMRAKISHELYETLSICHAILTPTTPTTAFTLGSVQDPLDMYACDMLTIPQGLAGIPAISVPFGKDSKGRPIGIQLSGAAFSENILIELGKILEE